MQNIVRNLFALAVAIIFWVLMFGINAALVMANYQSIKNAFELSGFEMRPLKTDELLGGFFGTFWDDATRAHWFAIVMSVVVAVGFAVISSQVFRILYLLRDRRIYLLGGDRENARVAVMEIGFSLIWVVVVGVLLAFVIAWDMEMFRFLSIAGAAGIEESHAATELLNWEGQLRQNGELFLWSLAKLGGWGYVAITALAVVSCEYAKQRVGDSWARLCSSTAETFRRLAGDPDMLVDRGFDGNAYGSEASSELTAPSEAEYGQAEHAPFSSEQPTTQVSSEYPDDGPTAGIATGRVIPTDEPLFDPARVQETPQTPPNRPRQPSVQETSATRREVIGGGPGQRIRLEEALADRNRYWVDPHTQEIWDARYREALFGPKMRKAA